MTSLSIARHTLQLILQSALTSTSNARLGLIGCRNEENGDLTIDHAEPIRTAGKGECGDFPASDCDLRHTVKKWHTAGATPCGIFFRSDKIGTPNIEQLEKHKEMFALALPDGTDQNPIQLQLMLGTAGCLEAFAWQLQEAHVCAIPLTLKEDGQESSKR